MDFGLFKPKQQYFTILTKGGTVNEKILGNQWSRVLYPRTGIGRQVKMIIGLGPSLEGPFLFPRFSTLDDTVPVLIQWHLL